MKEWDDCNLQGASGEPGSYVLAKPVVDIPPRGEWKDDSGYMATAGIIVSGL